MRTKATFLRDAIVDIGSLSAKMAQWVAAEIKSVSSVETTEIKFFPWISSYCIIYEYIKHQLKIYVLFIIPKKSDIIYAAALH